MTTEEGIRAALEHAASMAPDEVRVRAALAGRARRHRHRRAFLIAGGTVAAAGAGAAIGVPLLAGRPNATQYPSEVMRYRPSFLPPGYAETQRHTTIGTTEMYTQVIGWVKDGAPDSAILFFLDPAGAEGSATPSMVVRDVTVNGKPGRQYVAGTGSGPSTVLWAIEEGLQASVSVPSSPTAPELAVRIAESVVPDGATSCAVAMRFGWLPDGLDPRRVRLVVSDAGEGWAQDMHAISGTRRAPGYAVAVRLGQSKSALRTSSADGVPATVRGRPGLVLRERQRTGRLGRSGRRPVAPGDHHRAGRERGQPACPLASRRRPADRREPRSQLARAGGLMTDTRPATFEEFLDHRLGALLRYATVLTCDPHLAEDLVQDVLVRAQPRWNRIGGLDAPEAYVKRMVLNAFLSWRRRRASRHSPLTGEIVLAVPDATGAVDERDAMLRRIAGLPPRQRAVIALRYYENRSDAEIAELLGCSEVTVRSHISRALAALRVGMTGATRER